MSEIKSAIELAMERTNNLVMNKEERESLHLKDIEAKVKAVFKRYLENITDSDGAVNEFDSIQADMALRKSMLLNLILGELKLADRTDERLEALFPLVSDALRKGPLKEELETLKKTFSVKLKEQEQVVRGAIQERLRDFGVTGDAVEPNVQQWAQWRKAVEETGSVFEGQFSAWKEKARQTLR